MYTVAAIFLEKIYYCLRCEKLAAEESSELFTTAAYFTKRMYHPSHPRLQSKDTHTHIRVRVSDGRHTLFTAVQVAFTRCLLASVGRECSLSARAREQQISHTIIRQTTQRDPSHCDSDLYISSADNESHFEPNASPVRISSAIWKTRYPRHHTNNNVAYIVGAKSASCVCVVCVGTF